MCTKTNGLIRPVSTSSYRNLTLHKILSNFFKEENNVRPKSSIFLPKQGSQKAKFKLRGLATLAMFCIIIIILSLYNLGLIESFEYIYMSLEWRGIKAWNYSKGPWTVKAKSVTSTKLKIPRIVHQTFKSWDEVQFKDRLNMAGWRAMNPTWEFRYYDNVACDIFVETNFPQYLEAYKTMPRNIEKVDFFRYLVVLHNGGIYADTDVECRQPLDTWIDSEATFIAGIEHEFASVGQASRRQYARKRQLLQWTFASEPYSLVLSNVASNVNRLSQNKTLHEMKEVYATYERTGPGMWTDAIYETINDLIEKKQSFDGIRILPRVSLGSFPNNADGVNAYTSDTFLLHHFRGSWKSKSTKEKYVAIPSQDTRAAGHPVSIRVTKEPLVFTTLFVDSMSVQRSYHGYEIGPTLSAFGQWQAGLPAMERPSVMDVLVAGLRDAVSPLLIDISAGNGLFSVAASQIGIDSVAFVNRSDDMHMISLAANANGMGYSNVLTIDRGENTSQSTNIFHRLNVVMIEDLKQISSLPLSLNKFVEDRRSRSLVTRFGSDLGTMLLKNIIRRRNDFNLDRHKMVLVEIHGDSGIGVDEIWDYFKQYDFVHVYHAGRVCNKMWRESGLIFSGRHSKNYADDPEESSQSKLSWYINQLPSWCGLEDRNTRYRHKLRTSLSKLKSHRAETILFLKSPIQDLGLKELKLFGKT